MFKNICSMIFKTGIFKGGSKIHEINTINTLRIETEILKVAACLPTQPYGRIKK